MKSTLNLRAAQSLVLCLILCALPLAAQKKKDQLQKPIAGPRATALQVTALYVSANTNAQKVDSCSSDDTRRNHRRGSNCAAMPCRLSTQQ